MIVPMKKMTDRSSHGCKIRITLIWVIMLILPLPVISQEPVPPLIRNNYQKLTSCDELSSYVRLLDRESHLLKVNVTGQSVQGRDLYTLKYSSSRFGSDPSKIRVLIFAQQHGNEQAGKEGALLLAYELIKPEYRYLFDRIDLALVPQVNPDGSEVNERRNANDVDLNRNHLILSEPETMALHALFDQYLFEVTLDVHEYNPFTDAWKEYGCRKNTDVMIGTATNLDVSERIRKLSRDQYLPFIFNYLEERGFSAFEYYPGGPPEVSLIRRSTFDINDGRQSLAVQNTFSFIQEGMNGTDSYIENIRHRAEGQKAGMQGLLEYVYTNRDRIKDLVETERQKLILGQDGPMVSIQSEHIRDGQILELPLHSYHSDADTVVVVDDYRPQVRSLFDVKRPCGYLIPKCSPLLVEWVMRQSLVMKAFRDNGSYLIERYFITALESVDFEGDTIMLPEVVVHDLAEEFSPRDYYFIPADQLKGHLVILALEPQSMLGLPTYPSYACLVKTGAYYPVMRVAKK